VEKNPGDTVISATINRNGAFRFRALRVGEDTTLAQIIRLVDDAGSSKAPIARLADKVSGVFVPVVLGIALLTLAIWLLAGKPFEFALNCAVSVLVISCPCALGLATPVAIMVGTGKAAEYGILIKSAQSLETLHTVDTVALDKTGTITAGQSVVTELISLQPDVRQTELLTLAASVEMGSEHPLAAAVLEKAGEAGIVPQRPARFEMLAGRGVRAEVDGHVCLGGNEALLAENGIAAEQAREALDRLTQAGKTPLLFARDGTLLGVIAVADAVRETSRRAIEGMRQMGLHTVMLTGDNARTAEAIRREVGVDEVIAGILPAEKEACIRRLQAQGHRVAMVGDGINDAPALTRAEIGVAIGAGTDIAIDSADVVLMKNDLCDVLTAFRLSRAVIRNIHEDLFWAFFYNVLGIPLAAGALYPAFGLLLSPMIGAAAMSLSSVCVITNALRLRRFHDRPARGTIPAGTRKRKEKQKMITITLGMEGMACGMCEAHVNDAIRNAFPVASVESSHTKKQTVIRTEREISEAELHRVLDPTGYRMVSFRRTQD
jgi:heavy metal translocating P-type ATPase